MTESIIYIREDTAVEGYTHFTSCYNSCLKNFNKDFLLVKLPYNIQRAEEIRKVLNFRPIVIDVGTNLLFLSVHKYREWTTRKINTKNKGLYFDISLVHHNNSIKKTYRKIIRDLRKIDLSDIRIAYSISHFKKVSIYTNNKLSRHYNFNCLEDVFTELKIDTVNGCSYNHNIGFYNYYCNSWKNKFNDPGYTDLL